MSRAVLFRATGSTQRTDDGQELGEVLVESEPYRLTVHVFERADGSFTVEVDTTDEQPVPLRVWVNDHKAFDEVIL